MGQNIIMTTQKERLDKRRELLDSYEQSLFLPNHSPPGTEAELQGYLNLDRTEIESLHPHQAVSISVRLGQFSFYFHRCLNREISNRTWAQSELDRIVAEHSQDYSTYIKADHKIHLVCKENGVAAELRSIVVYAQQRIDRLSDLHSEIKNIAYLLSLLRKSKE